jgi:hypothetical protein
MTRSPRRVRTLPLEHRFDHGTGIRRNASHDFEVAGASARGREAVPVSHARASTNAGFDRGSRGRRARLSGHRSHIRCPVKAARVPSAPSVRLVDVSVESHGVPVTYVADRRVR